VTVSLTEFNIQALSIIWPRSMLSPSTDRYTWVGEWFSLTIKDTAVKLLFYIAPSLTESAATCWAPWNLRDDR